MKTQIKRIVLGIAFAIIAITGVNAEVNPNLFVTEQEPELQIESWMTSSSFGLSIKDKFNTYMADHASSTQSRMTSGDFHARSFYFHRAHAEAFLNIFTAEQEHEMEIENWMSDDSSWGKLVAENLEIDDFFALEQDSELEIERWMTEDYHWSNLFAHSDWGSNSFFNHVYWNKRDRFIR